MSIDAFELNRSPQCAWCLARVLIVGRMFGIDLCAECMPPTYPVASSPAEVVIERMVGYAPRMERRFAFSADCRKWAARRRFLIEAGYLAADGGPPRLEVDALPEPGSWYRVRGTHPTDRDVVRVLCVAPDGFPRYAWGWSSLQRRYVTVGVEWIEGEAGAAEAHDAEYALWARMSQPVLPARTDSAQPGLLGRPPEARHQ